MLLKGVNGDLFNAPQGCYLAHCISGDYTLGAGIAKKFNEVYDMGYKLHKNFPIPTGERCANVGNALLVDNVFNLVTKPCYYHKPTYETLYDTICDMKEQCEDLDVKRIAMPLIGCGLDKLDWGQVKETIKEVFDGMDIEITVYVL